MILRSISLGLLVVKRHSNEVFRFPFIAGNEGNVGDVPFPGSILTE